VTARLARPSLLVPPGVSVSVVWIARDASGNTAWCEHPLTLVDTTPPAFADCPPTIDAATDPGAPHATVAPPPLRTKAVAGSAAAASAVKAVAWPKDDRFPIGRTRVAFEATDAAGNSARCESAVVVRDDEPPTLLCPGDLVDLQNPEEGGSGALVAHVELPQPATLADNSGAPPAVTKSHSSGAFGPGVTEVVYTATDAAGNAATCRFEVRVAYASPCAKPCDAGSHWLGSSCAPCRPGWSKPVSGAGACMPCDPGEHQPAGAATRCEACPSGHHAPAGGVARLHAVRAEHVPAVRGGRGVLPVPRGHLPGV